ncbi:MAG TPA: SagB family peptide dehydrogenase [Tepidisphaeraceae bacterium]|jgi:SagB-type dehydrogenase family enzyme
MDRTFWIALPLVLFALLVLLRRTLGRPLTRHALNVQQALLLLVYFAATSALGIFWVANQQLPVFDLHYLFGYATVLLVTVHVVINWQLVWGYLRGPRRVKAPVPTSPQRNRRSATALIVTSVIMLCGGFALGFRYRPTTFNPRWTTTPATRSSDSTNALVDPSAIAAVEEYHQLSSHNRLDVLTRAPSVDWGPQPVPFKSYPDAPIIDLPPPQSDAANVSLIDAMLDRAQPSPRRLDLPRLSTLLFYSIGITGESSGFRLRAAPSSGALFPTEFYLFATTIDGLDAGSYHYDRDRHRLHRLSASSEVAHTIVPPGADGAIALTAVFRRTGYKYRDRAYRYAVADAGHALENLRIAATCIGVNAQPSPEFDESYIAAALNISETEEGVLALVPLLHASFKHPTTFNPAPPPSESISLGVTNIVHVATSLRALAATQPAGRSPTSTPSTHALKLPPPAPPTADPFQIIRTRRSVRRFRDRPLSQPELSSLLHAAAHAPAPLSRAGRVHVLCHNVHGIASGGYAYLPEEHALAPTNLGNLREASASAALSQDVIGLAAAVFVLSLDRTELFQQGPRGYRQGYLEAGALGERLYLQATALNLGACAVGAFYDDEAARLINIDPHRQWVVHFAAVGHPSGS